jgi:hypothetical protein
MAFAPLVALGLGVLAIGALTFWAALQNWLSNLIIRAHDQLGVSVDTLQNGLVIVDRVMVNGQRVVVATARVFFRPEVGEPVVAEEKRVVPVESLPAEVRTRLESGEPLTYELSVGSMQPLQAKPNVTYKLDVRRLD